MCKVLLSLLGKQKSEVLKILLDLYMLGKDFEWSAVLGILVLCSALASCRAEPQSKNYFSTLI